MWMAINRLPDGLEQTVTEIGRRFRGWSSGLDVCSSVLS